MNLRSRWLFAVCGILGVVAPRGEAAPGGLDRFIGKHCVECHDAETKKGGLDLVALKFNPGEPANFATWVTIHDRVSAGEMPPKKQARPAPAELRLFTNSLSSALLAADREQVAREGRATQRRLNRYEYEETLRDLLSLPYLEVSSFCPRTANPTASTKSAKPWTFPMCKWHGI